MRLTIKIFSLMLLPKIAQVGRVFLVILLKMATVCLQKQSGNLQPVAEIKVLLTGIILMLEVILRLKLLGMTIILTILLMKLV